LALSFLPSTPPGIRASRLPATSDSPKPT
jgi:hypothetical protein